MYAIIVFKYRDWEPLTVRGKTQTFDTVDLAEAFVQTYPQWGADWSRAIRNGNWQVVPAAS